MEGSSPIRLIWNEWGRVTRFIKSSAIAFEREEASWGSLHVTDKKATLISKASGPSHYELSVVDHLKALRQGRVLPGAVLLYSYALTESYARLKLGLSDDDELDGGVESWGGKLLTQTGHDWDAVLEGRAGIIEVSAVRNAMAHGVHKVTQAMVSRFESHDLPSPWSVGDSIILDLGKLDLYRSRLKSLMRISDNKKKAQAVIASHRDLLRVVGKRS